MNSIHSVFNPVVQVPSGGAIPARISELNEEMTAHLQGNGEGSTWQQQQSRPKTSSGGFQVLQRKINAVLRIGLTIFFLFVGWCWWKRLEASPDRENNSLGTTSG